MRSVRHRLGRFLWQHPGAKAGTALSPIVFWIALFIVGPLFVVLFYSFLTSGPFGSIQYNPTLENYQKTFVANDLRTNEPTPNWLYLNIFGRSLALAFVTTLICMLLGYPVAYWIALRGGRYKNLWIALFIMPFWTSYVVRIFAWMFLLRDPSGFINQLLLQSGLIQEPVQLLYNVTGVLIGMVYTYLPFAVIPLYASLERLDRSVLEAASDLGARPWQRLRYVTLPLTRGGIMSACVLTFVPAVGEYLIPDLMGGSKVNMIGNFIADKFLRDQNWTLGSAMSVILILIVMAILIIYLWRGHRHGILEGDF
ncbi:ABC transporter permease [Candidatus Acetothermia bacterium]|nr:ABC transporter permease [Candidatus Acetothermia bacterium]MBI3643200.1 ABC transporter permease [Candidatus Acetothermia bacterium]